MRVRKSMKLGTILAILLLLSKSNAVKVTDPTPELISAEDQSGQILDITYLGHKEPDINIEYCPINSKVKVHYIQWTADTHEMLDSSLTKDETSTAEASGIPLMFQ
jgi:hypothetical protein